MYSFCMKGVESKVQHTPKKVVLGSVISSKLVRVVLISLFLLKDEWRSFIKVALILFAAFLMFGGPTYLILVLQKLDISYPFLVLLGLASFTVGVILFTRLIQEEKT